MVPQVKPALTLVAGLLALVQGTYADAVANRVLRSPGNGPRCYSSAPISYSSPPISYSSTPTSSSSTTPTITRPTPTPTKTGIPSGPDPNEHCYRPTSPLEDVNYDELCKCDYYDPESYSAGSVSCWITCDPYKPEQFKVVPENDKLSSCIRACLGSFEKAKRAVEAGIDISKRQDEYWFCHAVNFVEGELCEFVGPIGGFRYTPWSTSCYEVPGLPGG